LVWGFDFKQNSNTLTDISCARSGFGSKQWVEIELENGDLFKCTEDHEVYTENRGWVQAKDLTDQDNLKFLP
jgi:intein/homing endonuclease